MVSRADEVAEALVRLDAWLETMLQRGGYGGPVAHWWQNRYRYAGPGLDWRYEGILSGYAALAAKSNLPIWRERLRRAVHDVMQGQLADGSYRASNFEMNPRSLGTPHEAAATLGLLAAAPLLECGQAILDVAKKNLDNIIAKLWDGEGFNDRPGVKGRVPNKLATLAHALIDYASLSGETEYLSYARSALADVLKYQVVDGPWPGAIHQYAPNALEGDGRYFPYYAARCVQPLLLASETFADDRYRRAAKATLGFLQQTMAEDGSWPQVVYERGRTAEWPRWIAGRADIIAAFAAAGESLPQAALVGLLQAQTPSGAFPTAVGFGHQVHGRNRGELPDYRDVTPVVGWNDKAFRLLASLLGDNELPMTEAGDVVVKVSVWGQSATFRETTFDMTIVAGNRPLYHWRKQEPWAAVTEPEVDVR